MNVIANPKFTRETRPLSQTGTITSIRARNLEIRLAETDAEIAAAQRLRYEIFFEEMGAMPTPQVKYERRDEDPFDSHCDHLIAIDLDRSNDSPFIVGTYRLLRGAVAKTNRGFYSAAEYELDALTNSPGEVVELGRSCVHAEYRRGAVMQSLWAGIAEYLRVYDVHMMFGCGSLPGTDTQSLMPALSYLHHFHLAPSDMRTTAIAGRRVDMDEISPQHLDQKVARSMLPPLIKGYMRVGGCIGLGAVVDYEFKTTDVCIIVPTEQITQKYHRDYKPCRIA